MQPNNHRRVEVRPQEVWAEELNHDTGAVSPAVGSRGRRSAGWPMNGPSQSVSPSLASVAEFSPSMFRKEVKAPHDFVVIRSLTTVNVTYLLT